MSKEYSSRFGKLLVSYRFMAGHLSQEELAERLGIERTAISKYETGKVIPPPHIVYGIIVALRLSKSQMSALLEAVYADMVRQYSLSFEEEVRKRAGQQGQDT